jgi:glycosyltransferase involved in cell wall biosynthesis
MSIKVSIIIPVFNKSEWIIQTLQSVSSQTYENWECIIVDDGSTDDSWPLISSYVEMNEGNWKIITQTNLGQSRARNAGIEKATGDYVAFLDADDLWMETKLQDQVNAFIENPGTTAIFSDYVIFELDKENENRYVIHSSVKNMCIGWMTMRGFGGLIESTGMVKRKDLLILGGFDESLSTSAGLDLTLRLNSLYSLEIIHKPLVLYRISQNQWHTSEVKLKEDVLSLRKKHPDSIIPLRQVKSWQDSYFSWHDVRSKSTAGRIKAILVSIVMLRFRDWAMLYFLISRNIRARLRGKKLMKSLDTKMATYLDRK